MTGRVRIWAWSVSGQVVSKLVGSTVVIRVKVAIGSQSMGETQPYPRRSWVARATAGGGLTAVGQLGNLEGCPCTGPSSCICTQTHTHPAPTCPRPGHVQTEPCEHLPSLAP